MGSRHRRRTRRVGRRRRMRRASPERHATSRSSPTSRSLRYDVNWMQNFVLRELHVPAGHPFRLCWCACASITFRIEDDEAAVMKFIAVQVWRPVECGKTPGNRPSWSPDPGFGHIRPEPRQRFVSVGTRSMIVVVVGALQDGVTPEEQRGATLLRWTRG